MIAKRQHLTILAGEQRKHEREMKREARRMFLLGVIVGAFLVAFWVGVAKWVL